MPQALAAGDPCWAVGMVPLSALPANAKDMALATDDYSQWMNIGNHTAPDGTKYGATSETWYKTW